MNDDPKKVRTRPEIRVGLCIIMVFRTDLDNNLTIRLFPENLFKQRK